MTNTQINTMEALTLGVVKTNQEIDDLYSHFELTMLGDRLVFEKANFDSFFDMMMQWKSLQKIFVMKVNAKKWDDASTINKELAAFNKARLNFFPILRKEYKAPKEKGYSCALDAFYDYKGI